jgi:hypothetical protein
MRDDKTSLVSNLPREMEVMIMIMISACIIGVVKVDNITAALCLDLPAIIKLHKPLRLLKKL